MLILAFFAAAETHCQVNLQWITNLDATVNESSGLTYTHHHLLTHNDSGGKAALYEVDTISGSILRTVYIANATNKDWEDLCSDQNFIYVGDIGNNAGSRTDLRIYRIKISDYFSSANDTVLADTINFNYSDQTNFTPAAMATKYDAESIISFGDSIYLFTKNWLDSTSKVYAMPKTPGSYSIAPIDSLSSPGLITGAAFNPHSNTLMLCGYIGITPFITEIVNAGFPFSAAKATNTIFSGSFQYSRQIEAICSLNNSDFYLSAEASLGKNASLFKVKPAKIGLQEKEPAEINIYPNPASGYVQLTGNEWSSFSVFDIYGNFICCSSSRRLDISDFEPATYLLVFKDTNGIDIGVQKLLVK